MQSFKWSNVTPTFLWSKLFPHYADRMRAMSMDCRSGAAFRRAELLSLEQ